MNPEPNQTDSPSFEEAVQKAVQAATDQVRANPEKPEAESKPRRPFLTRPPVIAGVTVVFLGIVAWNLAVFFQPPAVPTPQEEAQVLPAGLFAATQSVEAFRQENGRLPMSAAEAGLPEGTFQFHSAGDEYVLTAVGVAETEEYSSADGLTPLIERMGEAYAGGTR